MLIALLLLAGCAAEKKEQTGTTEFNDTVDNASWDSYGCAALITYLDKSGFDFLNGYAVNSYPRCDAELRAAYKASMDAICLRQSGAACPWEPGF